jgi:hypothetical protein
LVILIVFKRLLIVGWNFIASVSSVQIVSLFTYPLDAILEHCRTVHELVKTMKCGLCQFTSNLRQEMEDHFTSRHKACTPAILRAYQVIAPPPLRILMDPHHSGNLDPDTDTHQSGKPNPDPHPHERENQDSDPHKK